ncbi:TatD family hydrolase, partial [Acinetobacter baumannii]
HDVDAVREQARAQGVVHCVLPAVERSNWESVRLLAHRHGDSYALGIHPLYTGRAQDEDLELLAHTLQQHRSDPRLVAVGEIGLDYFVPGL